MSDVRRAALALHALGEADRQWMMERLPAGSAERLEPLLKEISELGFPTGTSGLALQPEMAPSKAPAPAPAAVTFEQLGAAQLAHVLQDESVGVVSAVLALTTAPARADVLSRLAQRRPMPIAMSTSAKRSAPRFMAALRSAVEAQAQQAPAVQPQPEAGSQGNLRWVTRWKARVAGWK